ncbi:hypothetical protein JOD97_004404 [Duganella sp. 1411]|uniref:hypothetical protein n=1 Tax=Duganella sp. 1411 TaxID=2806572 RepID=UPI001AE8377B|nr:hypothetical protein [Duganella sp. 1411]MBP1206331.1 hypothetical protein [Duganella sp. 1411]
MRFECLKMTNQLSAEKTAQIRYTLKHPLKADFNLMKNVDAELITFAKNLQKQCRGSIGLELDRPDQEIRILGLRAESRISNFPLVRPLKLDTSALLKRQGFIEMIYEDLHHQKIPMERIGESHLDLLVAFYLTTEALVLVECGAYSVSKTINTITLNKSAAYERALYAGWFCGMMNQMSKRADLLENLKVVQEAGNRGLPVLAFCGQRPELIDRLTDSQLDKALSLNVRFVHRLEPVAQQAFEIVYERARVATILQLLWVESQQRHPHARQLPRPVANLSPALLVQLRIPYFVWKEMTELSAYKPQHDKLFDPLGSDMYRLGDLSLEQVMLQYCSTALQTVHSHYGKWFEEEYLYTLINDEIPTSRYRVFEGGKAKGSSQEKFDVDLIIEDVEADRLFFCQVKYRHRANLPFFRSEWDEFFFGNIFSKGIAQLKGFEARFGDDKVIDLVKTRTGRRDITADYLRRRTSLLFVHNLNAFDFSRYDGIQFYEWNTLRNLLRRQIGQTYREENVRRTVTYKERVPLEDMEKAMAYLRDQLVSQPGTLDMDSEWRVFSRAKFQLAWQPVHTPSRRWMTRPKRLVIPFD